MANILGYNRDTAFALTAAATLAVGQLAGINSDGAAVLADADATTPIQAVGVVVKGGASGDRVTLAPQAKVEDPTLSLTPGDRLYTSDTAGAVTGTKPSTATDHIQAVGFAISATQFLVNCVPSSIGVQASGNSTVAFV